MAVARMATDRLAVAWSTFRVFLWARTGICYVLLTFGQDEPSLRVQNSDRLGRGLQSDGVLCCNDCAQLAPVLSRTLAG